MNKPDHLRNRLAKESSPYLLQHASNPVDWYPWGPEALERARKEQKPIFLSIGYSACHWCHVMEHESFMDDETASLMNSHFVNIKVDREERPDLDHIYMAAVQMLTQRGGWPMSVFLTPSLEPFYGGTYFPPEDRMGMPGFKKILKGVASAWTSRKSEIAKSATELKNALIQMQEQSGEANQFPLSPDLLASALEQIKKSYDSTFGGLGSAPKFFHTAELRLALRQWKAGNHPDILNMVTHTLNQIARGGICDQLGGGFHRYSTDDQWLVPHFEKMLYDNALLSLLFIEAFQATNDVEYAKTARETLDYVLREMTSPEGGFFATQDADSEGEEGKFYVWSQSEIIDLLGSDLGEQFCQIYSVAAHGNWEGKNILHRSGTLDEAAQRFCISKEWLEDSIATAKRKLLSARAQRIAPSRDEKILVSWNGLMIQAMALGYQVLGDVRYLEAAQGAARFILDRLVTLGKFSAPASVGLPALYHSFQEGKSRFNGYLDDYGSFITALIDLYESDFDPQWIKHAKELADAMIDQFWVEAKAEFYFTPKDHEALLLRPKELHDGATPSGSSLAITALLRLSKFTNDRRYGAISEKALNHLEPMLRSLPMAAGQALLAVDFLFHSPRELVLLIDDPDEGESALKVVRERFIPNKIVAAKNIREKRDTDHDALIALFQGKESIDRKTTLYVCENATCSQPLVGLESIVAGIKPL